MPLDLRDLLTFHSSMLDTVQDTQWPGYNGNLSTAINVIARLPPCPIGVVELLTFFPNHTQWPEAGLRLYRNGWHTLDIATVQLHARGRLSTRSSRQRTDALRHQVLTNGRIFFNDKKFIQSSHSHLMTAVTTYDASMYAPRSSNTSALFNASLTDIAEGVVNWPTGQDRGIVTHVLEYAQQNSFSQYTTSDIPQLAQDWGIFTPSDALTTQWDQNAR